jgi:hypothetical protein
MTILERGIIIFQNIGKIQFFITNTKIRTFENITSIAVCLENETIVNQNKIRMRVIAKNFLLSRIIKGQ